MHRTRHAALWLLGAIVISLGAAGFVSGADHPAGPARPELTARADAEMRPLLDGLVGRTAGLRDRVAALGEVGRMALSDLTSANAEVLSVRLADGSERIREIEMEAGAIRAEVAALPYGADSERISPQTAERVASLTEALAAVEPLADAWDRLAGGSVPALALLELLDEHDRIVVEATLEGSSGGYVPALAQLDQAAARLAEAQAIRDRLARAADVSTLDAWIDRLRTYDEALTELYTLLRGTNETVTDEIREAFAAVRDAEAELPQDRRALVVIMADIAEGGLNQAVIAIDRARGRLTAALGGSEPP